MAHALPRQAQGVQNIWFHPCSCFCSETFALVIQSPSPESIALGFGPVTQIQSKLQRRLLDTLDTTIHDYLDGGVAREDACAAIADLLLAGTK